MPPLASGTLPALSSTYAVTAPVSRATCSNSRTRNVFPTPALPCTWKRNRCRSSSGATPKLARNAARSTSRPTKPARLRRRISSCIDGRACATLLTATVALYIALVAFGNITDFGTNQQFVRHVLAMDTTFKDDDLMWRAVLHVRAAHADGVVRGRVHRRRG